MDNTQRDNVEYLTQFEIDGSDTHQKYTVSAGSSTNDFERDPKPNPSTLVIFCTRI